jgi:hypothetical protein
MIKLGGLGFTGYVSLMKDMENRCKSSARNLEGKNHSWNFVLDRRLILNLILREECLMGTDQTSRQNQKTVTL